jgi:hypothetical protein
MSESTPEPAQTPDPAPAPRPAPPAQPAQTVQQQPDPDQDLSRWKAMSRQNEGKWQQATQELEKAKQDLADRDLKLSDLGKETAGEVAAARLEVALARAGMGEEQAANFIQYLDRGRLLKDGKPDPDAIKAIPASLRSGPPDPDQGRANGSRPLDMNSLIRQRAGIQ